MSNIDELFNAPDFTDGGVHARERYLHDPLFKRAVDLAFAAARRDLAEARKALVALADELEEALGAVFSTATLSTYADTISKARAEGSE